MSDCCTGLLRKFDEKVVDRERRRFLESGPLPTSAALAGAVRKEDVEGATVLDVGGGLGVVHGDLLEAGAVRAVQVEVSPAFTDAAREIAEERGYRERVEYRIGDFVEMAPELRDADVVILDRVICCYPDAGRLVGASADKARRIYGAVYPRDRLPVRAAVWLQNLFRKLARNPFRVWVHPISEIERPLFERGFRRRRTERTFVWEVAVYVRETKDDGADGSTVGGERGTV